MKYGGHPVPTATAQKEWVRLPDFGGTGCPPYRLCLDPIANVALPIVTPRQALD